MMTVMSGTPKVTGITRITGEEGLVEVVGIWDRGVVELLGEGGDEPGELGVDRNRILTGVGTTVG